MAGDHGVPLHRTVGQISCSKTTGKKKTTRQRKHQESICCTQKITSRLSTNRDNFYDYIFTKEF